MAVVIAPLSETDRAEWEVLARGYKAFYRDRLSDLEYERFWRLILADETIHGLGARSDGRLVGISHHLFHVQGWLGAVCYLQDLFTAPEARGQGVARALIEAIAEAARAHGAARLYWLTAEDNAQARALYDRVARYKGFIRYDYPL